MGTGSRRKKVGRGRAEIGGDDIGGEGGGSAASVGNLVKE